METGIIYKTGFTSLAEAQYCAEQMNIIHKTNRYIAANTPPDFLVIFADKKEDCHTIHIVVEYEVKFNGNAKWLELKTLHARTSKLAAIKLANTLDENPDVDNEIREVEIVMKPKLTKVSLIHIEEEWRDDDGYWIVLKKGWKNASDPIGNLHTIHEDTSVKAWRELVMPCNCEDCNK